MDVSLPTSVVDPPGRRRCRIKAGVVAVVLLISGVLAVIIAWSVRRRPSPVLPPSKVTGPRFDAAELVALSNLLDGWAKEQIQNEPSPLATRLHMSLDALFAQMMDLQKNPGFFRVAGQYDGYCKCGKVKQHACQDCYSWFGGVNMWGLSQTLLRMKGRTSTPSSWDRWYRNVVELIAPAMERESPYAPDIFEANPDLYGAFVDDQMWYVIGYTQLASLRLRGPANITSDDVGAAMRWLSYATHLYNATMRWGSRQILLRNNSEKEMAHLPPAVVGQDPSAKTLHIDYKCMVWFSSQDCVNSTKACQEAPAVSALDKACAYAFGLIPPLKLALTCENLAAALEQQPDLTKPDDFDRYCSETVRKHHVQVVQVRLARLRERGDAGAEYYTYTNFAQVYGTLVAAVLGASYGTVDPYTNQPTQVNETALLQIARVMWQGRIKQVLPGTFAELGVLGDVVEYSTDSRGFKAITLLQYIEMGHLDMELSRKALTTQGGSKPAIQIRELRDKLLDPVKFPAAQLFAYDLTITNNGHIPIQPTLVEENADTTMISYPNKRALYFANYWLGKESVHPVQKRSASALLEAARVQATTKTLVDQIHSATDLDAEGYACTATQVGGISMLLTALLSAQQNETRGEWFLTHV